MTLDMIASKKAILVSLFVDKPPPEPSFTRTIRVNLRERC